MKRVAQAAALLVVAVVTTVWLGFRLAEGRSAPDALPSHLILRTTLYDGLPAGLQYYLSQTVGRAPLVSATALLWGTGRVKLQFGPLEAWLPMVWREAIDLDRGFVWRGEVRWFHWTLIEREDRFVDGVGSRTSPEGVVLGEWVDQALAMRRRAEFAWLPSALVTRSGSAAVDWNAHGSWEAALRYPGPSGQDSLVAVFDSHSRALKSFSGIRARSDTTTGEWLTRFTTWGDPGGLMVPVRGYAEWNGAPYYEFTVVNITYNVSVADWFAPRP
jgi:hypothetical protein